MNKKIEVYIMHQYDEKSHFEALYKSKEDIIVKDYIILSKFSLLKQLAKNLINGNSKKNAICEFNKNIKKIKNAKRLSGENIIVGIAPYDTLLIKYKKIFKNNKSIYFTSWQDWSGKNFARGKLKNKEKFEKILKEDFYSAACVTKKTENEVKFLFKRTEVVNHSINVAQYLKKEIKNNIDGKKKILYLGQLIERKNISLLIEWININISKNECEFYFAGDGELKEEIKGIEKQYHNVKYLGRLNKDDIRRTLKNYDFLVLPSKNEPFGIVLIEALASGVPCIVSNCYGPKEIIRDGITGFIFDKNNKNNFFDVMTKALNIDNKKYIEMSRNCINESYKYDIKSNCSRWKKVIL